MDVLKRLTEDFPGHTMQLEVAPDYLELIIDDKKMGIRYSKPTQAQISLMINSSLVKETEDALYSLLKERVESYIKTSRKRI